MTEDQIEFERFIRNIDLPDITLLLQVITMLDSDSPYDERWAAERFGPGSPGPRA